MYLLLVLPEYSVEDRRRKNYLPRILSIDEFKSVNTVDASMSVNLTDLEERKVSDIM